MKQDITSNAVTHHLQLGWTEVTERMLRRIEQKDERALAAAPKVLTSAADLTFILSILSPTLAQVKEC